MAGWKEIGRKYADDINAKIPEEWRLKDIPSIQEQRDITGPYIQQFLSAKEIEITETGAVDIVAKTTSGQWTAVEVAKAFCHRAAVAHQLLNCLHEIFFDLAILNAEMADQYLAKHKKPMGALHGLPVSLKDQFHVKGVGTHMGYIGWIDTFQGEKGTGKEKVFESVMVEELKSLGATLYCKTAVPHTLMSGETVNNIIGYTYNPRNRLLSAGGSSGGEGALIGALGSPLGFGTDIGGSIRIPAGLNGLFGLRPSFGRLPYHGMANSMDGQITVPSVVGPIAPSPDALRLATESLLSTNPWFQDPNVVEIPWRDDEVSNVLDPVKRLTRGLAFGVLPHDGGCAPHPPVTRAVSMVAEALKLAGHNLIEWQPKPTHPEVAAVAYKAWSFDGGADLLKDFALSGEDPAPQTIVAKGPQVNASDIMAVNIEKRSVVKQYMDYWNSTAEISGTGRPVDAFIMPLAPFAAPQPNTFKYYAYTSFANVLDLTIVTLPVTYVDKDVDKKVDSFKGLDAIDQANQDNYEPDIYHGAPVSIQLVGRRFQEEKMIAIAKYVSELLKKGQAREAHL